MTEVQESHLSHQQNRCCWALHSALCDRHPTVMLSAAAELVKEGVFVEESLRFSSKQAPFFSEENFNENNYVKSHIALEEVVGAIQEPEKFDCKVKF